MKGIVTRKLVLGIAERHMEADGRQVHANKDWRIALFRSAKGF